MHCFIYRNSPNVESPASICQTKIDGLTQSGMCFMPKELEGNEKSRVKEVVDVIKNM